MLAQILKPGTIGHQVYFDNEAMSVRNTVPKFIETLRDLVDNPALDNEIRWNESGTSIVILDIEGLSKNVLSNVFKSSNFASFVRQLNMYGFRKVHELSGISRKPLTVFHHPDFVRSQPARMSRIVRRQNAKKAKRERYEKGAMMQMTGGYPSLGADMSSHLPLGFDPAYYLQGHQRSSFTHSDQSDSSVKGVTDSGFSPSLQYYAQLTQSGSPSIDFYSGQNLRLTQHIHNRRSDSPIADSQDPYGQQDQTAAWRPPFAYESQNRAYTGYKGQADMPRPFGLLDQTYSDMPAVGPNLKSTAVSQGSPGSGHPGVDVQEARAPTGAGAPNSAAQLQYFKHAGVTDLPGASNDLP
eukprot:Clim_evm37s221 gene=Clim_evmTU37s221